MCIWTNIWVLFECIKEHYYEVTEWHKNTKTMDPPFNKSCKITDHDSKKELILKRNYSPCFFLFHPLLCLYHSSLWLFVVLTCCSFLTFLGNACLNGKSAFLHIFFFLGKIEVKILTRKNAEEAGDQWLTEEDTKSFRELLINLLVTEVIVTFIGFIWILLGVSYAQFNRLASWCVL